MRGFNRSIIHVLLVADTKNYSKHDTESFLERDGWEWEEEEAGDSARETFYLLIHVVCLDFVLICFRSVSFSSSFVCISCSLCCVSNLISRVKNTFRRRKRVYFVVVLAFSSLPLYEPSSRADIDFVDGKYFLLAACPGDVDCFLNLICGNR